jgi:hypothetical protein
MPLSHYPMKKRSVRPMRLRAACNASGSAVVVSLQISAPPLSGVFITVAFPQPRVAHASRVRYLEDFEERRYDGCNSCHEDDTVGSPEIVEAKIAESDDVRISPLSHLPVLLLF